jgi:hypothetical protein
LLSSLLFMQRAVLPFDVLDGIASVLAFDAAIPTPRELLFALGSTQEAVATCGTALPSPSHALLSFVQASSLLRAAGLRHSLRRIALPFLPDADAVALCNLLVSAGWGAYVRELALHERCGGMVAAHAGVLADAFGSLHHLESLLVDLHHSEAVSTLLFL